METYSLDIDAGQIVRWLLNQQRAGSLRLDILATRSYVVEALTERESQSFGDEEAEDLSDVMAVGVLEVRPPAVHDGWLLRLRVEDRIGPRSPEDDDGSLEEEEIDLETFDAEFIRPERGTVDVTLETEDAKGKARFTRLFNNMLRDKHPAAAG
jgi:hypothetical protein